MAEVSTTEVRDRRRNQTREEILRAAWDLAEQRGIANVSLREIAEQVGMRAPSLYTYFPSKAAIYDAMFADGYARLNELMDLEVEPDSVVETLTSAVTAFLQFCQASIPRYQLMFTRVIPGWDPSPEAYASSVASYELMAAQLARAGITGEEALDLWTALTAGLAAQQVANDPTGDRWARLSRDAAQMFVDHLRRNG